MDSRAHLGAERGDQLLAANLTVEAMDRKDWLPFPPPSLGAASLQPASPAADKMRSVDFGAGTLPKQLLHPNLVLESIIWTPLSPQKPGNVVNDTR